jgi:hypothetical protein
MDEVHRATHPLTIFMGSSSWRCPRLRTPASRLQQRSDQHCWNTTQAKPADRDAAAEDTDATAARG